MVVVAIIAIVAALMIGLNSQTYGTSPRNVSDTVASALNMCKMRAVSQRRWHRCTVTPTTLTINQGDTTGMATPATWTVVRTITLGTGVSIWDFSSTACTASPCTGAPSAANTSLSANFDFRPDGSSTGGTVFVANPGKTLTWMVVVYKSTGSAYARNFW
jgi:Tfp pilus assembly protein FimT